MFRPPSRTTKSKTAIVIAGMSCIQMWCSAAVESLTLRVADVDPLGLANVVLGGDALDLGMENGIKGDFSYGLGVSSVYDSNFFLSEDDPESEFSANFSPWINYRSDPEGGARVSFTANYSPVMRAYMQNPDLKGTDQNGNVSMTVSGTKTVVSLYMAYNEVSGTDRLTGGFVNGSLLTTGIQGSYQIAPRTSLFASWTAATSEYGSDSIVGSDIYTAQIGGFWSATERFSFGPAIRYSVTESDNTGTRDAWALYMQARYRVGERIQIIGSLGLEHAKNSNDSENSTVGLTGGLTANYAINERWGWTNGIQYVTVPSPTESSYMINNLSISTALSRQLLRATVGMGLDLNISDYEEVGSVGTDLGTEHNLGAFISYQRELFSERLAFESKFRYAVNDGAVDWSQFQLSAGLIIQF